MASINDWNEAQQRAAQREGWDIFHCDGSAHGDWQVCRLDFPRESGIAMEPLADDSEAWKIVHRGIVSDSPLHCLAGRIIAALNPNEHHRIMSA